jgi:transposase
MPAHPLTMHQIEEILRLHAAHLSQPQIARALCLSLGVINKYLQAARRAKLSWPLPTELTAEQLQQRLFPVAQSLTLLPKVMPDFAHVHQELKRKGVTRLLLWEEYAAEHPQLHYSYSRFTELYQDYRRRLRVTLRQTHRAGEKLFVDYAGPTVDIIDRETGEVRAAQIFVAVLGASNFTYVEATWTQSLPDWCGSHVRAFEFLGGVPEIVVPDNLKAAVTQAARYEPVLNRTYTEMLAHYGTAAVPARPYKPRDKAKAEVGVQIVERWLLARLRKRPFFSLAELNQALRPLLDILNDKPFQKLPGSRRTQFATLDQPTLKALPPTRYEYAQWLPNRRVAPDAHVEVESHFYSAPHALVGQLIDARVSVAGVEFFHQHQRVAVHLRSEKRGGFTTLPTHLPTAQQLWLQTWNPGRFLTWAVQIGAHTRDVVRAILTSRTVPQQAYRSCFGLLSLAKTYSSTRLEAACQRALILGLPTRKSVLSILQKGLEDAPLPVASSLATPLPSHANIRGAAYYQQLLQGESTDAHPTDTRHFTQAETARHGKRLPTTAGTTPPTTTRL